MSVEQPWSRATPPGATIGAGFMQLKNAGGTAQRVVGASSPVAGRVEMHVTTREGDVMKMRQVQAFDIPAGGSFELKPGGVHLMLVDLRRPLNKGEKVPLTLKLEKGGELKVDLTVEEIGARRPAQPR
ncbi:MAG: copper chaperone PCu(A)C [Proteobacteria bacterium]|nr:copper chaperone PCu(A)C [Pseudomonadota bacterium]